MVVFLTNAKYPKMFDLLQLAAALGGSAKVVQYYPFAITNATNRVPLAVGYTVIRYLPSSRVEEAIRLHRTPCRGL